MAKRMFGRAVAAIDEAAAIHMEIPNKNKKRMTVA